MCGWLTCGVELEQCRVVDVEALTAFLGEVDLTLSGLDAPSVRLWIERDESGAIVGSTGYEISSDGRHVNRPGSRGGSEIPRG